jgi:hypothetical protein
MRKIILTAVGAAVIAMTGAQVASAGEHHARKPQAQVTQQFRNANNSVAWPTQAPTSYSGIYSGGWSAPAGQ